MRREVLDSCSTPASIPEFTGTVAGVWNEWMRSLQRRSWGSMPPQIRGTKNCRWRCGVWLPEEEATSEPVVLRYGGAFITSWRPAARNIGEAYENPGIIDERGVFLAGASYWIPTFGDGSDDLRVRGGRLWPSRGTWSARAEGRARDAGTAAGSPSGGWITRPRRSTSSPGPGSSIRIDAGEVEILTFLREDDPALAGKYLEATKRYLKLYEAMLPAFPYRSFAFVENFWETGYGMPGFTLLGFTDHSIPVDLDVVLPPRTAAQLVGQLGLR